MVGIFLIKKERWKILNLVSSKSNKIFLCLDSKFEIIQKVDIILSPEFYWVRIFDIPVKNINQAKDVLPTLFEDILDNTEELSYQVLKLEDNKYLCFAYFNKKIYEAIKNSSINLSFVNSIYFAQNECKDFKQFIIEGKSFLYTEDNILVKVPNGILSEELDLNDHLDSLTLSSNKIDIKLYNNFLSTKQIYSIIGICLFISIINFTKMYDYKLESTVMEDRITLEKEKSNLPSSILQVNSIIDKYKNISNNEIKKRDAIDFILQNKNIKINSLSLEKNVLILNIKNSDKKKIEEFFSKKFKILSLSVDNLDLNIRIQI